MSSRRFRRWCLAAVALGAVVLGAGAAASRWLAPELMQAAVSLAQRRGVTLRFEDAPGLELAGVRFGPVRVLAEGASASIDRLLVRPSLAALLREGELRPGWVAAEDVRVIGPAAQVLDFTHVEADVEGSRLTGRGWLRDGGLIAFGLTRSDTGATRLEATLRAVLATADRDDFDLRARVSGVVVVEKRAGETAIDLELSTDDLALTAPSVTSEELGPLALGLGASLLFTAEAYQLRSARVALGEAEVELSGELLGTGVFHAELGLEDLALEDLLAALPEPLLPPAEAPRAEGRLSGKVELSGNLHEPASWVLAGGIDTHAVTAKGTGLGGSFVHRVVDADGVEHAFVVGPENPDFVPLSELPAYVPRAVTTGEDGGFFAHQGFDLEEMLHSAMAVAEAGRAVRGGSTITQQLAKNLYLSREKTYARKAREALVTLGLEAAHPKARLLEIYLNVIEWGPGIYGLGPAARTYFGKDARDLTPKEAVYLASIIPSPRRYYTYFTRGELTDTWNARLVDLLAKMTEAGSLSPEGYAQAVAAPVVFVAN